MTEFTPMLKARVRSGLLLGAALLAAVFLVPPWGAWAIVSAVVVLGLKEFYGMLEAGRIPCFKAVGTLCGLALIAAAWFARDERAAGGAAARDVENLTLFAGAAVVFARMLFQRKNPRPLETMAGTLLGLLYVGYLTSFFLRLATAWGGLKGRWLVIYLVVVVKGGDIAAYFVGCRFGRHKLIPRISPAKSWEGAVAGLLGAVAASLAARAVFHGTLGPVLLPWAHAVALGLGLAIFGIFGDLLESLMKRAAGVKDSGTLIAGMGGLLDVVDSLLLAAPALYFYARWLLPPAP